VVFFGSGKLFSDTVPVVFYFEGSVKGLDVGAPLMIRGVKVGGVTAFVLYTTPMTSPSVFRCMRSLTRKRSFRAGEVKVQKYQFWERKRNINKLIENGLRGQLDIQSFVTGQLMVNLDFLPFTKARLVSKDPEEIEIPTVPTVLMEVTRSLQNSPWTRLSTK